MVSRFNLKWGVLAAVLLAPLVLSGCWSDPVGPTTCVAVVPGDGSAAADAFIASQPQPVDWVRQSAAGGYFYDGWGTPFAWAPTEDSDLCVVAGVAVPPTSTVWFVNEPPVPRVSGLEASEQEVSE